MATFLPRTQNAAGKCLLTPKSGRDTSPFKESAKCHQRTYAAVWAPNRESRYWHKVRCYPASGSLITRNFSLLW